MKHKKKKEKRKERKMRVRHQNRLQLVGRTVVDNDNGGKGRLLPLLYEGIVYVLAAVLSALMLRGIMQNYCAIWDVEYRQDWNRLFFWISVAAVFVAWIGRWTKWISHLAVIGLLLGGLRYVEVLTEGAKEFANPVLQSWYDYYSVDLGLYELNPVSELETTMTYIALWLALGFVWVMVRRGSRLLLALPGCAIIALGLLVGKKPGMDATICLLVGVLPALAYAGENILKQHHIEGEKRGRWFGVHLTSVSRYRVGIGNSILTAVILILGVAGFRTVGNEKITPHVLESHKELLAFQRKLEADIENFAAAIPGGLSLFGGGNAPDGKVTNRSPFYVGKDIFTVTVEEKPATKFYFRGFVGSEYENGQWFPTDCEVFEQKVRDWGVIMPDAGRKILNKSYAYGFDVAGREINSKNITMEIQYMDECAGYAYVPYYTNLYTQELDSLSVDADAMLYKPENVSDISLRTLEVFADAVLADWAVMWWDEEEWLLDSEYTADACKTYVQLPQNELSQIKELADTWRGQGYGVEDMDPNYSIPIQKVTKELAARTEYTRRPGYLPDGEDVVEYFLFENKRGFCVHYASAGTLLLRGLGVPARYVSGYAIDPSDFTENEDGTYTAVVEDNNGHAWVEVYMNGTGWIPIEVTEGVSSMNYGMDEDSLAIAQETREWMKEEGLIEETPKDSEQQSPDVPKPGSQKPQQQVNKITKVDTSEKIPVAEILKYVLFGAILIAAAGVGIYRICVRIGKKRRLLSEDTKVAIQEVSYRIAKLLYHAGILSGKNLTDEEYIRIASEKLEELGEKEFPVFMAVVQKTVFSEYIPTMEEVKMGRHIYQRLKKNVGKK